MADLADASRLSVRPKNLTIDRSAALLKIDWMDGHESAFALRWLRANCPCAACREERRILLEESDPLRLYSGPLPSAEVVGAELVGNYAIRLDWRDGHNTGIYPFTGLRVCCPCLDCNPNGQPPLLLE